MSQLHNASALAIQQARVDQMSRRFSDRVSDGSFGGRRGLYEHHARVLRQARAELAARKVTKVTSNLLSEGNSQ